MIKDFIVDNAFYLLIPFGVFVFYPSIQKGFDSIKTKTFHNELNNTYVHGTRAIIIGIIMISSSILIAFLAIELLYALFLDFH